MSEIVVDASAVVSALTDSGRDGDWSRDQLATNDAFAPELLLAEATNILRRTAAQASISEDTAQLARADLLRWPIELLGFRPFADRCWQLRDNVTTYDAWYVSVAESLDAPLITLDRRLARAAGPRCAFRVPD